MRRLTFTNSSVPLLTAGTLSLCVAACKTAEEPDITQKKPNIVLILSDDQGYNELGIYGRTDIITPNLDQLGRDGVRFTNFYVTCAASTPSRASLLTGRYPQRNGTYELFRNDRVDDGYLYPLFEYEISPEKILGTDEREILVSDLLHKAGYVNGMFGKWDMGQLKRYLPLQRGFDSFYGLVSTGIDYYTHERYGVHIMYRNNELSTEDKGIYATYLFEREAVNFIKENKEKPFFLYLAFNAPHASSSLDPTVAGAIQAPSEYLAMYPDTTGPNSKRRGYMAATTCMDESVGNIIGTLDSLNLSENTIVIFLSDNGGGTGAINTPLRGGKATMWEGGLRVPCIIKWPGKIQKGAVIENFVSSLELFPTILSVAGVEKPDSLILDGFDMLPLLIGEKNLEREEMYWEFRDEYAARVGEWKWLESKKRPGNKGLYNLSEDIGETNDLSAKNPEKLKMAKDKFLQWQRMMSEAEPRSPFKNF